MRQGIDDIRTTLGELAAMAERCDRAEREILGRAISRLAYVEKQLEAAGVGGDVAELVEERGVLGQVIARAKRTLNGEG